MEKSILLRKLLFLLVLTALLFPVIFISWQAPLLRFEWDPFLLKVGVGAIKQAVLSTVLTLAFGVLASFGLFSLSGRLAPKTMQILQFALILPGFVPPLLVVTLSVRAINFLPTGLWAVVFFHVLMNMGLVTVLFYHLIRERALGWLEFAKVANVPKRRLIFRGILRELRGELQAMGFYFFVLYFFSFSIPFLVGGSLYGGIEVFLYEKVVLFGEWGQAAAYSLLLFAFMFGLSLLVRENKNWSSSQGYCPPTSLSYLGVKPLLVVGLLPVLFLLFGFLVALPKLFQWEPQVYGSAFRGTLLLGLAVGLLVFCILSLLTFTYIRGWMGKFLLAFVHPGWVIVGFAFLLLPGGSTSVALLKIIVALTILYLPFLYRLSFHEQLQNLHGQVQATRNFAVPWSRVFGQILFPQVLPSLCLLSGLAGLWACGDFAITGFFVETSEVQTLAFQMKETLSHYRSEQAVIYLWPLVICGAVVFFSFQGLSYVSGQKTKS